MRLSHEEKNSRTIKAIFHIVGNAKRGLKASVVINSLQIQINDTLDHVKLSLVSFYIDINLVDITGRSGE